MVARCRSFSQDLPPPPFLDSLLAMRSVVWRFGRLVGCSARRRYEMLVRVRDFGDNYGHLFPGSSVARENVAAVAAAIKELDAQALRHMAASASALVEQKSRTRDALRARLQAIGLTARVLAEDAPGLDEQFPVPPELSDQRLLTTGRKFARDVEPLSSQFIAHGMPVTFVAELNALVDAPAAAGAAPESPSGTKAA